MNYPRIFGPDLETMDTYSNTLGLGTLIDATACKVTEVLNGMYELQLTYPMIGERFSDLQAGNFIVAKPYRDAPGVQPFYIYKDSRPMSGQVTFYARHISYKALGIPIRPVSAQTAQAAISAVASSAVISMPFTLSTDVNSATPFETDKPATLQNILLGTSNSLVSTYSADVLRDGYSIQLLQHRGTDRGARIVYGRNLMDLTQDKSIINVYDAVYPYYVQTTEDGGIQLVELASTLVLLSAASNAEAQNVYPLDLSSEFDETPDQGQILQATQEYIAKNNLTSPNVNLSLKYVDLSRTQEYADMVNLDHIELGDTVTVQYPQLGIDVTARATKLVYDVLLDAYESLEVGDVKTTVANTIAQNQADSSGTTQQIQKLTIKANQATQAASDAAKTATDYITEGSGGLVIYGRPGSSTSITMGTGGLTFDGIRNRTVLWQNSSPGSMSSGTHVNVNLSSYNAIAIGFIDNLGGIFDSGVDGTTVQYQVVPVNGTEQRGFYIWDYPRVRTFTPTSSGVTFGAGGYLTSNEITGIPVGANLNVNSACCVPYVIYGFM